MIPRGMKCKLRSVDPVSRTGRVRKITQSLLEADGPEVSLGTICSVEVRSSNTQRALQAEVVRVDRDRVTLVPIEGDASTFVGALVTALSLPGSVTVGDALLGRVVDPLGRPLDDGNPISGSERGALHALPVPPLERRSPTDILETGVRAIDGLLTLGRGQRVGIFAASGVGKTSLFTQIAQHAASDVLVMCLVGERGREVEAIWNQSLDNATRKRATLVAATSDQTASLRLRAAHYALAQAEYWRDQGKHVLLMLDSVTRLAMAMREVGLAAGEPPTIRAYTPNVFSMLPRMVERCGAIKNGGSISALMTVLSESDEIDDPICELMKSLLDGHIILSRALAEQGHFPAIDVSRSVSRQADRLVDPTCRRSAQQVLDWLSQYERAHMLVETGLYVKGSDAAVDKALERNPHIIRFLRQGGDEYSARHATESALSNLVGNG